MTIAMANPRAQIKLSPFTAASGIELEEALVVVAAGAVEEEPVATTLVVTVVAPVAEALVDELVNVKLPVEFEAEEG